MLSPFETPLTFSEAFDIGVKKIGRNVFRYIETGVKNITRAF